MWRVAMAYDSLNSGAKGMGNPLESSEGNEPTEPLLLNEVLKASRALQQLKEETATDSKG